jgi:uncharacterized membrane protein
VAQSILEVEMDWYSIVKFLHVIMALIWVGGGFAMMVNGTLADRAGDDEATMRAIRLSSDLGGLLMMPASLLTLVSGLAMCWFWIGFADLWITIGLAGYAATFLIGVLIFKPTSERLAAMVERDGITPAALSDGRGMMKIARFDYSVMLVVVADMVLKPTSADTVVLTAMAVVLLIGAAAAFGNRTPEARSEA